MTRFTLSQDKFREIFFLGCREAIGVGYLTKEETNLLIENMHSDNTPSLPHGIWDKIVLLGAKKAIDLDILTKKEFKLLKKI